MSLVVKNYRGHSCPKMASLFRLHGLSCFSRHAARCHPLFPGPPNARSAFRRPLLHWSDDHAYLLPPGLSGPFAQRGEHPLLSDGCGRGRSRTPSLPAMPPRVFAGNAGMAGDFSHGVSRLAADQRERSGGRRWRYGRAGRAPGHWLTPSAATVPAASGRQPDHGGANPAPAVRQETD